MNLQRCRILLRPRNPLDCLDLTLVFLRDQAWPFFNATALFVFPPWVLLALGAWWTGGHWSWLLFAMLIGPVVQVPFVVLGGRLFFSATAPLGSVMMDVLRCGPGIIAWLIVDAIAFLLGFVFCMISIPIVQSGVLFMGEAILLERVSVQRGLQRSMRLGGRHHGIALFGAITRWVLIVWMALLFEAFGQFLLSQLLQLGTPLGAFSDGQVTPFLLLGLLVGHAFFALFRLILYMDVRTRMEGWDLQVALRALALAGRAR